MIGRESPESLCGPTRMDTAETARKAIAPADSSMTGTVLPAGCWRRTDPVRTSVVLTRSPTCASAICGVGSRGPYPLLAAIRSLRSAARRSAPLSPASR
jgi:hypothetical protein